MTQAKKVYIEFKTFKRPLKPNESSICMDFMN